MTDTDRFRRLFEEHRSAVFGFAVRRVGRDLADEVLAETFLVAWRRLTVAWRRLTDVPADAELRWLLATARLVLANMSRSSRRRDRVLDRTERVAHEPDHAPQVAQSLDVQRALARLRAPDQEVLRLIEWDDLAHADAAALLDCSRAALAVRLRRARARLAAAMAMEPAPSGSAREGQSKSSRRSTPDSERQVGEDLGSSSPLGLRNVLAVPNQAERSAK